MFRYQTTYHKVGVILQHSFAELWGRFEEFWQFFTFFPKFFEKFWSVGSSRKPIQKLGQYLLSMFRFSGFSIRSQLSKNFGIEKKCQVN